MALTYLGRRDYKQILRRHIMNPQELRCHVLLCQPWIKDVQYQDSKIQLHQFEGTCGELIIPDRNKHWIYNRKTGCEAWKAVEDQYFNYCRSESIPYQRYDIIGGAAKRAYQNADTVLWICRTGSVDALLAFTLHQKLRLAWRGIDPWEAPL